MRKFNFFSYFYILQIISNEHVLLQKLFKYAFRKKMKKIAFSEKVNGQGIGEIDNFLLIPIIQSL